MNEREALQEIARRCPAYAGEWSRSNTLSDFGGNADDFAREMAAMDAAEIGDIARAALASAPKELPMNEQQINLLASAHTRSVEHPTRYVLDAVSFARAIEAAALASAPAATQGEAVAWDVRNAEISYRAIFATEAEARTVADQHDEAGYSQAVVTPLYTTPQPTAPAIDNELCEKLAALGWQTVACAACGSSHAQGYPQPTAPARAAEATQPAAAEQADEHGQLHPLTALEHARAMLRYVQNASAGQKFDPIFDDPERRNWAAALDNLEETAAMLLNMADRVATPPSQAPAGVEAAQQVVVYIQRDHLQKALVSPFLCRVEPTQRLPDFVPLHSVATSAKSHPQEGRMP